MGLGSNQGKVKCWKAALRAGHDVNHNEEASLAEVPLLPPFHGMNKYLLSTYYFLGNLSYTQLNEKLQFEKGF